MIHFTAAPTARSSQHEGVFPFSALDLALCNTWRTVNQSMKESSITNFGLLIAFLLPGFVALWGLGFVSPEVQSWLGASPANAPTVGGFLYVSLASIVAGMAVTIARWLVIDSIHHATGISRPRWDFSRLQENVAAFDMLNELYYRHYQCYANMIIAIVFANVLRHLAGRATQPWDVLDAASLVLIALFFVGSRDSLRKYYRRGEQLLAGRCSR
jgi:hypothetical protein